MTGHPSITAADVKAHLAAGGELAFLDVREAGQYGIRHPLRVVSVPFSVLEARVRNFVPRRSTPVVLLDDGDGVSARAAARLGELGYTDVAVLEDGIEGWAAAGLEIYRGVNVPSKAFGEVVEHRLDTPRIEPAVLHAMRERGENHVVVDGRTPEEFHRMCIPGGVSVPNAELVYRIHELAPDPDTTVVVNCAGRTRSIIGAQALINAGLPNPVVALKGGTMGWRLAGYELEHGCERYQPAVSEAGRAQASLRSDAMRARYDIDEIDWATFAAWQADEGRTTYLLDVRSREEFEAGHLPGSVHAPGGQLVQATDQWCATWGARLVLADDGPMARAVATAHWMKQMEWEVAVLPIDRAGIATERGVARAWAPDETGVTRIDAAGLALAIEGGAVTVIDVDESMKYRAGHLPGARWATRARLAPVLAGVAVSDHLVFYSEHETRAWLAARDAVSAGRAAVRVLAGGREGWRAGGRPLEASADTPSDAACIDHLFWVADRHQGNDQAARDYLSWEENLPAQLEAEGEGRFPLVR